MNKYKKNIAIVFLSLSVLVSCRKDSPNNISQAVVNVKGSGGVYITNEGNFQFGNAKVSFYDIPGNAVTEDLFQPANNAPLGDVCESMCLFNGKAYIVLNNSNKVVVVDPVTFVQLAVITGFTSPRYFLPISNSKAYVTDLHSNSITIVDLNSNTISGSIPCKGWTEEVTLEYGKAFVTNEYSDKVFVINTLSDLVEDSIMVAYGGNSITQDKNGKIWVLCGGNQTNSYAGLFRIDPVADKVEQSFPFPSYADQPWRLNLNGGNDTLYYLDNDAYRLPITASTLPATPFVARGSHNFYGIGIDPKSSTVYVADAIDYVQRGIVYRYKSDGTLINSFPAGIIPAHFYFN